MEAVQFRNFKAPLEVVDIPGAMTAMGNFKNPCSLTIVNRFN